MTNRPRLPWITVTVALVANSALAEDDHFQRTVQPAASVLLRGYWRANDNCEPKEPPSIILDEPPHHGIVCFRSDDLVVRRVLAGPNMQHCVGRHVRGLKIVYQSQPGCSGEDEVRYTVMFPQQRHTVLVDLTVLPSQTPADQNLAEPMQSPGPLPACAVPTS